MRIYEIKLVQTSFTTLTANNDKEARSKALDELEKK